MNRIPLSTQSSRWRHATMTSAEIVIVVALATGAVAALQSSTPVSGLEVLYLPAVLAIAIRRGQLPAFMTALLSVLTVNYLFIVPRHQLRIAHSQDLVELAVLTIAAGMVGRLASTARQRAAEAELEARVASARERESGLLAQVASAILAGHNVEAQLDAIGPRIARAIGARRARVVLESVPTPREGELARPLRTRTRPAWLYVTDDADSSRQDLERICEPLGGLVDVAIERERAGLQAAEAEAARRADTARTAVLHAISHDLRSPLTAITTAGAALAGEVTPSEHRELLEVIDLESARLAKLVDDILDLSKIQAGAVAPQTDWCDLRDVIASAVGGQRSEHPVELALPEELPLVRADAAQLERVFSNLVENAVKFSPPDHPVRVTAGAGAGRVTVRVVDRGCGIAARDRPRVFEPFFRGSNRSGSGSGLGLAICHGFVEANGGQIVLGSSRGGGTSFAVTFPAVPIPVEPAPVGPASGVSAPAISQAGP